MDRIDQKIFAYIEPVIHLIYKVFGVTILICLLLTPFFFLYYQCNKNYALIQEVKQNIQDVPEDISSRKIVRENLFSDLTVIKKQNEENNKLLKELKRLKNDPPPPATK